MKSSDYTALKTDTYIMTLKHIFIGTSSFLWIVCGVIFGPVLSKSVYGEESTIIKYGEKKINIRKFMGINDYLIRIMIKPDDGTLFWVRSGFNGNEIVKIPDNGQGWQDKNEETIYHLGMRSFVKAEYHIPTKSFYLISDVNNNETFNIYRFHLETGKLSQITNFGYLLPYQFAPKTNNIIFSARIEKNGQKSMLGELDVNSPENITTLYEDNQDFRIYPYDKLVIDKHNTRIAFVVKKINSRSQQNIAVYSRKTGKVSIITDSSIGRNMIYLLAWRKNSLLFISDEGREKQSLYTYDFQHKKLSLMLDNPLKIAAGVYEPSTDRLLINFQETEKNTLLLLDPETSTVLRQQNINGYQLFWLYTCYPLANGFFAISANILGKRDKLICSLNSNPQADEDILKVVFQPSLNKKLAIPCEMEDITYPTFDMNQHKRVRMIKAVLFKPKKISKNPAKRAAIIWAHGGPSGETDKNWDSNIQILTHMGYIVLGPNPRGSTGQGKSFEDLNNQDWGGGDYRDYVHGLYYLKKRFNIPSERIGIAGFSFGGYMTNWAVTRPDNPFGFGISMAGISNLFLAIRKSVISTNTISDMGDTTSNKKLYRERSPIYWSEYLNVPLLMIHGTRDNRTVTLQSQIFFDKLNQLGKDVKYIKLKGEGHGFRTIKSQKISFQEQANFLYRMAPLD